MSVTEDAKCAPLLYPLEAKVVPREYAHRTTVLSKKYSPLDGGPPPLARKVVLISADK